MTLFPLLPPMMTAAVCRGLMPRLSTLLTLAGPEWIRGSGRAAGKKSLSAPVADGASPDWPAGPLRVPNAESGPFLIGETGGAAAPHRRAG